MDLLILLIERRGAAVTRIEIHNRVWGNGAFIDADAAINTAIGKLREALSDDARAPRFIATIPRRGYRFIAEVETKEFVPDATGERVVRSSGPTPIMVGREAELARIAEWYSQALSGQRRIVLVAGEPGIGKSTFVSAFLDSIAKSSALIGCGQCIEQYGTGEPYMPLLEALTRIAHSPGGQRVVELLRKLAPVWLAQIPALLSPAERERLQAEVRGVTPLRMLREIALALEAMSVEAPVVLSLEDLHWSDHSTLEVISTLARRSEAARLLIVGTFRPVEVLSTENPLRAIRAELQLHKRCEELLLPSLSEADVGAYVDRRFGARDGVEYRHAAPLIYRRSEGNPLYMVNIVNYLVECGSLADANIIETPRSVQQMIERNLERLDPVEQRLLEAASVAGREFSAAAIAAALDAPVAAVEERCSQLARREQFLDDCGAASWPDGTLAASFRFHHALYNEVLYARVAPGRREELHRHIAERLERGYGEGVSTIAAELAHHFQCANDRSKAIDYFLVAGDRAKSRAAYHEAVAQFTTALQLIDELPQSASRDEHELTVLIRLRGGLYALAGPGDARLPPVLDRAMSLCRKTGRNAELASLLRHLAVHHHYFGDIARALTVGEEAVEIASRIGDPISLIWAEGIVGNARYFEGSFPMNQTRLENALRRHRRGAPDDSESTHLVLLVLSRVLQMLGFRDQARRRSLESLEARKKSGEVHFAEATTFGCDVHYYCGEVDEIARRVESVWRLLAHMESEYPQLIGWSRMLEGWVTAERGQPADGLLLTRDGFEIIRASRQGIAMPLFECVMAAAEARAGQVDAALATLDSAFRNAEATQQHFHDSEIQRLRGEFLLMRSRVDQAEVERCFREAIVIARRQSAKSWELRASTSLTRLLDRTGRRREARSMLTAIYNWFTEGFDTRDLIEARTLLDELNAKLRRGHSVSARRT
ncbi:MAG: AAA family ATPase, partial [Deltaproteobacteria bacterium]|nr:AAA family ATPase [Deltaproteobacteria bacterium]